MKRLLSRTALLLAGSLTILTACSHPNQDGSGNTGTGRTYTTRAQVTRLPDPAYPGSGIYLSHEAIDDFVDREGKTVGMDPMNMPFPLAPGVSPAGIAPGDIVEIDLHVDWQAATPVAITRIRKLPADTQLVFRAAKPSPHP